MVQWEGKTVIGSGGVGVGLGHGSPLQRNPMKQV